jgi:hypothetical protein
MYMDQHFFPGRGDEQRREEKRRRHLSESQSQSKLQRMHAYIPIDRVIHPPKATAKAKATFVVNQSSGLVCPDCDCD